MTNRDKLKTALVGLSNHNSGLGEAFKSVENEMKRVAEKIRQEAEIRTVEGTKKEMKALRQDIESAFSALIESFDKLKSELGQNEQNLNKTLTLRLDSLRTMLVESKTSYGGKYNILSGEIENIKNDIKDLSGRKIQIPDFSKQINKLESDFEKEILRVESNFEKEDTTIFQNQIDRLTKDLSEIRTRTLSALSHGGQANRNMLVNGNSSTLSRYTDLNIKAGANVTLSYTNNDNLKTTDLTIASGAGSSINFADSEIPGGAVNGVNVTFSLAHTPNPTTSLIFNVNGQTLSPAGVDMTLSGSTVTVNTAPPTTSAIICWYRY